MSGNPARDGWPYLVLAALVAAVFALTPRPFGGALDAEGRLPDVAPATAAELRALRGLTVAARGGLPAFSAAHATPEGASGPLGIGGLVTGLLLEGVVIELSDDGGRLEASRARFDGDSLDLDAVRLCRGETTLLVGGRARLAARRLAFTGLVVIAPDGPQRVERLDAVFEFDALVALAAAGN